MLKRIGILVGLVSAMLGLFPPVGSASAPPAYQQRQMIQEIVRDTNTPEKKAEAVAKLMSIVRNPEEDINLREYAAQHLGDMGAVQAENTLRELVETLDWKDPTRELKRIAYLACWKIRVASEPNKEKQVQLLTQLLHERFKDGMIANNVQTWAAEELVDRSVQEALPEIIKSVKDRGGSDNIGVYTTKIELLSTSPSRQEAFTKALVTDYPTDQNKWLKQWAIAGLAALNTQETRTMLLNYAIDLQNKYYDETGRSLITRDDLLGQQADGFYNSIITVLKDSGMTDTEIRNTGLRPDKFFRLI